MLYIAFRWGFFQGVDDDGVAQFTPDIRRAAQFHSFHQADEIAHDVVRLVVGNKPHKPQYFSIVTTDIQLKDESHV